MPPRGEWALTFHQSHSQSWPHIRTPLAPFVKSPGLHATQILCGGAQVSVFFLKLPKVFWVMLEIRTAVSFVEMGAGEAGRWTWRGMKGNSETPFVTTRVAVTQERFPVEIHQAVPEGPVRCAVFKFLKFI